MSTRGWIVAAVVAVVVGGLLVVALPRVLEPDLPESPPRRFYPYDPGPPRYPSAEKIAPILRMLDHEAEEAARIYRGDDPFILSYLRDLQEPRPDLAFRLSDAMVAFGLPWAANISALVPENATADDVKGGVQAYFVLRETVNESLAEAPRTSIRAAAVARAALADEYLSILKNPNFSDLDRLYNIGDSAEKLTAAQGLLLSTAPIAPQVPAACVLVLQETTREGLDKLTVDSPQRLAQARRFLNASITLLNQGESDAASINALSAWTLLQQIQTGDDWPPGDNATFQRAWDRAAAEVDDTGLVFLYVRFALNWAVIFDDKHNPVLPETGFSDGGWRAAQAPYVLLEAQRWLDEAHRGECDPPRDVMPGGVVLT